MSLSSHPKIIAHRAKMHAKRALISAVHATQPILFDVDAARCEAYLRTGHGTVARKARTLSRGTARAVREGRAAKAHDDAADAARALNLKVETRLQATEVARLCAEHGFDSTKPADERYMEIASLFAEANVL